MTRCVLDGNRTVKQRWQVSDVDQLMQRLLKLPAIAVCFEASTGSGRFHKLLKPLAARVAVAHPGLLRLIFRSKQKNDRADAWKPAKLLSVDEAPEVHVPPADVRAWRELITFRKRLIDKRTAVSLKAPSLEKAIALIALAQSVSSFPVSGGCESPNLARCRRIVKRLRGLSRPSEPSCKLSLNDDGDAG